MDNSNSSSSSPSNNRTSQNLAMINDSGGPMSSADGMMNNSHEVVQYQDRHGENSQPAGADLIATALDAANICAQDAAIDSLDVVNTVVETSGAGSAPIMEEGIIYRNPSTTPNTSTGNSKVHFISNLTLVPKHQQQHHSQQQPPRTGQNIIFLNNSPNPNSGASLVAKGSTTTMSSVAATNYINAFVSAKAAGGVTTATTTGKVVNLLHATGSKSAVTTVSGQSLIPQHNVAAQQQQQQQQRVGKSVQVLKRLPVQQQQSNVIGRAGLIGAGQLHLQQAAHGGVSNKVGAALQTQKPQNVVISGSSLLGGAGGGFKTLNSGKLVNAGLYNNPNNSTTTPTMKMVNNGQQQLQVQHKTAMTKYTKGGVLSTQVASTSKLKNAAQLSKYQPKVVQVQQAVTSGGNYSTTGVGGPTQWRVDMRGRGAGGMNVTAAGEEVVIGGGEISGIVHRPAIQGGSGSGGVISVQGSSPAKVITMNSNKYTVQQQQPMLMMSGGGGVGKAMTGNNYATHTVQMSSPGQYSVIGGEDGQQQQQQGTIKYVNAQGNVVQQQQQPAGKYKVESSDHHNHHSQVHNVIQFGSGKKHTKQQPLTEDIYVNGTQMNDEMSARLLQSFSQKATSRYAAAHAPGAGIGGQGASGNAGAQQGGAKYQYSGNCESASSSGYHPQTSVLQHGTAVGGPGQKHGPEYFRVK